MITIPITNKLFIRCDEICWTLVEIKASKKSGKEREDVIGYYSNLKHLAEGFATEFLKTNPKKNVELQEAFDIMNEGVRVLGEHIDEIIKGRIATAELKNIIGEDDIRKMLLEIKEEEDK